MRRFPILFVLLAGVFITYRTYILYISVFVAAFVMLRLTLIPYQAMRTSVVNHRLSQSNHILLHATCLDTT